MIDPLLVAAERWPATVALADAEYRWTWSELLADANDLRARCEIRAGTRVALLARDTGAAVVAIHAIRLAGAMLVPLNRRLALAESQQLLGRSGATRLFHDDMHAEIAGELARADDADPTGVARAAAAVAWWTGERTRNEVRALDEAAAGALVFTSGTTGTPRGALLTHGNLLASARAWNGFLDASPDDHWLAALPLSHVAGLGLVLRSTCSGARLTVHDRFDPDAVRAALAGTTDPGVSHLSLVPTQLARLLEAGRVEAPRLRALLLGGAPIPAPTRRAGTGGRSTGGADVWPDRGRLGRDRVTAGRDRAPSWQCRAGPCPGLGYGSCSRRLRRRHRGEAGDILVAGPTVFAGYDGDPAATDRVLRDGWLRTGDMGSLDDAGRLTVLDRRDDLVISGGENVSPAEVEAVLAAHPDVIDAAVRGPSGPDLGRGAGRCRRAAAGRGARPGCPRVVRPRAPGRLQGAQDHRDGAGHPSDRVGQDRPT